MMSSPDPDRGEEFLRLLNEHESSISAYVHALVRDFGEAQDILQDSRLTMWKSFDQFELGTNFKAWARQVAFNKVLTWRRKQKRRPLDLSDETIELIAAELDREAPVDARSKALRKCVTNLTRPHRQVLLLRYSRDVSIGEIADRVGRTEGAVYRLLSRLRSGLVECINEQMKPSP